MDELIRMTERARDLLHLLEHAKKREHNLKNNFERFNFFKDIVKEWRHDLYINIKTQTRIKEAYKKQIESILNKLN